MFMRTELARLKEEKPDMAHKERCVSDFDLASPPSHLIPYLCRFKLVVENWNKQKESNPKA